MQFQRVIEIRIYLYLLRTYTVSGKQPSQVLNNRHKVRMIMSSFYGALLPCPLYLSRMHKFELACTLTYAEGKSCRYFSVFNRLHVHVSVC